MISNNKYQAKNYTEPLQRRNEHFSKEISMNNDGLYSIFKLRKEKVELSDSLVDIFGFFKDEIEFYTVTGVQDYKYAKPYNNSVIDIMIMMD